MIWTRVLLAVACWALLLPRVATLAQDTAGFQDTAAQSVAHGVMAMPADMMVWQSELQRAVVAPRAAAQPQPGGFVLADTGALAIADGDGKPLQRLASGQAAWIAPGDVRAIVSLEGRSVGYLRISLIPASFVPRDPGAASHGDPFAAPSGVADVDLLRDILERGEELVVNSGEAPAFLLVQSGKVFARDQSGEITEVVAGTPFQFQGDIVVSGGSRAPAAFVIARVGPPVPVRLALLDPHATPLATPLAGPRASPLPAMRSAALMVDAWVCPPGYDESAPILSCTTPAAGVRFTAEADGKVLNALADDAGTVAFPELPPAPVSLGANLPAGATTAVASCRNVRGDAVGRIRDSTLSLNLQPGAKVSCSWFIAVGETWPAATLSVSVFACPPGMTAEALHPEYCLPAEAGDTLRLSIADAVIEPAAVSDGSWVWGPLLEDAYDLKLWNLPPGFNGAVLDDGAPGAARDSFRIDLGGEPALARTLYLLQPPDAEGAERDSDADGLTDAQELALGTDPFLADTDGDGLEDGDEVAFYGTDPLLADTDSDGLDDKDEVAVFFTNPFLADTDGDGIGDADELSAQTDPLDMLSRPPTPTPEPTATPTPTPVPEAVSSPVPPAGTPSGIVASTPVLTSTRVPAALPTLAPEASPVSHRVRTGGTPITRSTAATAALDNDGLATLDEIAIYGTDPLNPDTDGDGMNDGDEVASGRNPLDAEN